MEEHKEKGKEYLYQRFPPGMPLGYSLIFSPIEEEAESFNFATVYSWQVAMLAPLRDQDIVITDIELK